MSKPKYEMFENKTITKPKRGVVQVKRYSFEITHELCDELDHFITHQRIDGTKMSKSEFIRTAISKEIERIRSKNGSHE